MWVMVCICTLEPIPEYEHQSVDAVLIMIPDVCVGLQTIHVATPSAPPRDTRSYPTISTRAKPSTLLSNRGIPLVNP